MTQLANDEMLSDLSQLPKDTAPAAGMCNQLRESDERAKWEAVIDDRLIEWGRNPQSLDEDGFVPPSPRAIEQAFKVAYKLQEGGLLAPTSVLPDGDGGIVFRLLVGSAPTFEDTVACYEDGTCELLSFIDCQLTGRSILPVD